MEKEEKKTGQDRWTLGGNNSFCSHCSYIQLRDPKWKDEKYHLHSNGASLQSHFFPNLSCVMCSYDEVFVLF